MRNARPESWKCRLLWAMLLALLAAPGAAQDGLPQELPEVFDQRTTGGVSPLGWNGAYVYARHLAGDAPGFTSNYTSLGAFVPFGAQGPGFAERLAFLQPQFSVTNDGEVIGNVGLGGRWLVDDWDRYFGASLWYDVDSSHRETFQQIGVGLESRGAHLDFLSNIYVPLNGRQQIEAVSTGPGLFYLGRNLVFGTAQFSRSEAALAGLDMEIGGPVPGLEEFLRAYAGWYHFQQDGVEKVWGAQARVELDVTRDITTQVAVYNDEPFGTSVLGGVSWFFGSGGRDETSTRNRMWTLVDRRDRMVITEQVRGALPTLQNSTLLTDAGAGTPIEVVHVDSRAAEGGDGTFARPYNDLQEAQAGSSPGDIILAHVDSVFDNPANNFITLQPNQRLLGEGPGVSHFVSTQQLGVVALPPTQAGGGSKPLILSVPVRGGLPSPAEYWAVGVRDGNEVNNFTINDSQSGIRGLPGAQNILISNMTMRNMVETGIEFFDGASQVTITDSSFGSTGFGGINLHDAVSPTIRNVTVANTSSAVALVNQSGTATIENLTSTNSNGLSITGGGGTVNATSVDIDGGGTGVALRDFDGTVNFSGLLLTNQTIDPLVVSSDPSNPAASTIVNVDATSRISQSAGRRAFLVNRHDGTINFAGTIDSVVDEGMFFREADGTYNFTGDIRLGAIDDRVFVEPGVRVENSNADALRFSDLRIFSSLQPGLVVTNSTNVEILAGAIDTLNADGIELNNADHFSLNNTTITTSPGFFTIDVADSQNLSGSGNTAIPGLFCNDGGGNSDSISFGAQGTCP